jgi:hypothetical protein
MRVQIDPLLAGLTPLSPLTSTAAAESGDAGAFDEALQAVMTGVDQAKLATVDALWSLQQRLLVPAEGWYRGQAITNLPAAFAARQELLSDFTRAIGGVLQDYGISAGTEMRFRLDEAGQVRLATDHPERTRIEALVNGSPLLSSAITRILQDTQRIAMAALAQQGKATAELADAMRQGLTLTLLDASEGLVSEVRHSGTVLVSSKDDADWKGFIASLEQALHSFDAAERERRVTYEMELSKLKLDDERRRTQLKTAKDKDLADKLADQEAAERRANLHPENGHTPIFI